MGARGARRTLLIEQASSGDGDAAKGTKTGAIRTVQLLAPLVGDLASWRSSSVRDNGPLFPRRVGTAWTMTDYRNRRSRRERVDFEHEICLTRDVPTARPLAARLPRRRARRPLTRRSSPAPRLTAKLTERLPNSAYAGTFFRADARTRTRNPFITRASAGRVRCPALSRHSSANACSDAGFRRSGRRSVGHRLTPFANTMLAEMLASFRSASRLRRVRAQRSSGSRIPGRKRVDRSARRSAERRCRARRRPPRSAHP